MSRLSGPRAGQEFVHQPASAYIGAYGLWMVTFLVGLLVAYLVRDVYQMAMVFTAWDRYLVHLLGQFSVVVLVILLLILLVSTEAYYRNGVPRRQTGARFARVMGILALVVAAAQGFRLVLEVVAGSVNLISVLVLGAALLVYAGARGVGPRPAGKASAADTGAEASRRRLGERLAAGVEADITDVIGNG